MKTKSRFTIATRDMFLWALVVGTAVLIVLPPEIWADEWTESKTGERTLLYKSESDENIQATSKIIQTPNINKALHAKVELFYPTGGQSPYGACWMGLRIDSHDTVYSANSGGIYKILPDGTLVNGVDDQNLFIYSPLADSFWFELDESGGNFYRVGDGSVHVAPFVEGSHTSVLITGIMSGQAITLGQGSLAGSLFVTESENQVSRITLSPLGLDIFASGPDFFNFPETIATAPDGTLYVVNNNFIPPQLTKITSVGVPSTFAIGTLRQVNRAVIVDNASNVYWSQNNGINKYDARGNFLGTLPLPPPPATWGPMGSAFDSKGNLYVVNNWGCKEIYKYTFPSTKDQCKNGGWKDLGFNNQGQCIK